MIIFRGQVNGQAITDGLRAFNEWRDDFLIELSTLMLMIGFVAGTVDVFTKGFLSTSGLFNVAWAIVQAIAIDGLFFAVWGRIAKAEWSKATVFKNVMLVIVGLLLAVVATLVNGILSYQELMSASNVKDAMAHLGVDQSVFTYSRSILVVVVSILVALFCRSKKPVMVAYQEERQQTEIQEPVKRSTRTKVELSETGKHKAIPESAASVARTLEDVARKSELVQDTVARQDSPSNNGYVAIDDGDTVAIANGEGQSMIATGSHRDRIKQVMLQAMHDSKEMTYGEIAEAAGAGYSTVKKWAPDVRKEIESSIVH